MPDAFVTAVFTPPAKLTLAPLPGALNVTVAPLTGLELESLTTTTSGAAKAPLIVALWLDPLTTAMLGPPITGALTVTMAVVGMTLAPLAWMVVDPPEIPATGIFVYVA